MLQEFIDGKTSEEEAVFQMVVEAQSGKLFVKAFTILFTKALFHVATNHRLLI